ncbi:MAG: hypothetical protein DRJ05_16615 [Bacteroidetes bacterium]|nr:MAG: hypothetical protein DRJ05_16615 [Bacteroidota bacterium]
MYSVLKRKYSKKTDTRTEKKAFQQWKGEYEKLFQKIRVFCVFYTFHKNCKIDNTDIPLWLFGFMQTDGNQFCNFKMLDLVSIC